MTILNLTPPLIAALIAAIFFAAISSWDSAASESRTQSSVSLEAYGLNLTAYTTVERPDGTYRRMLIPTDQAAAIEPGKPLPDGTRILMETYYQPGRVGTVFHKQKRDGRWQYGSFPASRPSLSVRPQASCLACHARTSDTDFTFTKPSLDGFAADGLAAIFTCDRGGRSPCAADVYVQGASR